MLTEKQREKATCHQTLTANHTLDSFLTRYFEDTQKAIGWRIDFALFKRIAFHSGVPLLIVDLVSYLTGQTYEVKKAMKLLKERVEPKRISRIEAQKKASAGLVGAFNKMLGQSVEKKLFKVIPPLKDFPEEIESEDSDASETYSVAEQARCLGFDIEKFKQAWIGTTVGPGQQEKRLTFASLENFYINYAKIKWKRRKKHVDERTLVDYELDETSFLEGWRKNVGPDSDIVAKIIYIRASEKKDHVHFNFL